MTGGKQYSRMMNETKWKEQPVSMTAQGATEQVEGFANLISLASSKENKGIEKVGGKEVYHLSFSLAPQSIPDLFKSVPVTQLSAAAGANVDVWVEKETYYRVKYERAHHRADRLRRCTSGHYGVPDQPADKHQPAGLSFLVAT